ncbi:MAG: DinB family protein [Dehalococcoidia bacterium]|nr:DinB family protein [Dehalococcoidia bacterium]
MDELIARLAATPRTLAHLVAEAPEKRLDMAFAGGWSARTILAHFRDDEYLCMRVALERMLAEDSPALRFIDGAEWEPGRNRARDRKEWLLGDFALQRQASLGILRSLRPADLTRKGTRGGRELTLEQLVGAWVRHDREHVGQLEQALGETLEQVRERRERMD